MQKKAKKNRTEIDMLDVLEAEDKREMAIDLGWSDDYENLVVSPRQKVKKRNLVQFYLILVGMMDQQGEVEDVEYQEDWAFIVGNVKHVG